jgi:hypothetical protein
MNLVKHISCVVSLVDNVCVMVVRIMSIEMFESLAVIESCIRSNALVTCDAIVVFCNCYIYIRCELVFELSIYEEWLNE